MALIMARPWKDPNTGVYHLKQRLPADLRRMKGTWISLPVGDAHPNVKIGDVVQVSLRTKSADEAKARHAKADDSLRQHWEVHRSGPSSLTHKQAVALAGRLYKHVDELHSDDPGSPDKWMRIEIDNLRAKVGKFGGGRLLITQDAREAKSTEDRYGWVTDALLSHVRLAVDEDSRGKLLKAVQEAVEQITERLRWNAQGDYSTDLNVDRFPVWDVKETNRLKVTNLTIGTLFRKWEAAHVEANAPTTIDRYRGVFNSLAAFCNNKDVSSLTGNDVHDWAMHRRDNDKVNPRSINSVDLVALSSVFKWAQSREGGELMLSNPAAIDKLHEPRSKVKRPQHFYDAEIKMILSAASAIVHDEDDPTFSAAKRWCPWLAAYSGARVTELTALTGDCVKFEAGIPMMEFRETKTNEYRAVPIHEHLVDQGFMDFAAACGSKPLFYELTRARIGAKSTPSQSRSKSLARWIRADLELDTEVKPDHGWRHTWKNFALDADIAERISDAITGHRVKTVGAQYQHPTLKMMAKAMARFPRYNVWHKPHVQA